MPESIPLLTIAAALLVNGLVAFAVRRWAIPDVAVLGILVPLFSGLSEALNAVLVGGSWQASTAATIGLIAVFLHQAAKHAGEALQALKNDKPIPVVERKVGA